MQGMQGTMSTEQMMRNVDQMMTGSTSMMRDLATMHASMAGHEQHDAMMKGMQGMLDQMKQVQGQMNIMAKDHGTMNADAMKSFQLAYKNLEEVASSFQSMTKNVTTMMKGLSNGPKK